jgi:ubiquinone/menaquinone biosynthesis C-methylase UbiE/DNA-binding transcriptional ArsR family regulator
MPLSLKSFRLLGDPTRVRVLLLLEREELSVAELQEILARGQSQISTHLSQLKQAGLVEDRRTGKNIFYRLQGGAGPKGQGIDELMSVLRQAMTEVPEAQQDFAALKLVIGKRRDKMRNYFDSLAGKFGREYLPGRSWEGLAETLLRLMPPMVIADLGAGEGTFSQLLALRAKQVIAIDNSQNMVEFGRKMAKTHGLQNLDYRLGDLESVPIENGAVDVAFFSQSLHHAIHPEKAVEEAFRIVKPGGRIAILDLLRHQFEEAREMYADVWLGFTELELRSFLKKSGFRNVQTAIVHREADPPHFATVSAFADKAP